VTTSENVTLITTVPEPAAIWLLALAFFSMMIIAKQKNHKLLILIK
jgi:hypothetical protein